MSTGKEKEKLLLGEHVLGTNKPTEEIKKLANKHTHLRKHLKKFKENTGVYPQLVRKPEVHGISEVEKANVLYPLGDMLFAHAYTAPNRTNQYYGIEPELTGDEKKLYKQIRSEIVAEAPNFGAIEREEDYRSKLEDIYKEIVSIEEEEENRSPLDKIKNNNSKKFTVPKLTHDRILYMIKRDIAGLGPLEILLKDKNNEDIHVTKPNEVYVFNKLFRLMKTNVDFGSDEEYKELLAILSKRVGQEASEANPIVDAVLPDGSRLNIIYSEDVSVEGPTLTIRQYEEEPPSIFQIVKWGTMSPELAAYLWLCLESDISIAICGETAAGKTTTLNAMAAFIEGGSKIYTAEDTPEVKMPHKAWQRLIARKGSGRSGTNVPLFELVKSSLRSRPDYIVIGEVRGEEAFNVFQAMQTGHPTLFTFHAGDIATLVNRFTGEPLNVPETFFGNLNLVVFQNFIRTESKELRRITSVQEIEGYSKEEGGIVTKRVFSRDPSIDRLRFMGKNNSYILEEKVASTLGYGDPREIYPELNKRARIIQKAITNDILKFEDVTEVIRAYQREGLAGLPFKI